MKHVAQSSSSWVACRRPPRKSRLLTAAASSMLLLAAFAPGAASAQIETGPPPQPVIVPGQEPPPPAHAPAAAPPAPAAPAPAPGPPMADVFTELRHGHELALEMGAGGDSNDLKAGPLTFETGLSWSIGANYLYRPIPWIAAGLGVHYSFMSKNVIGAAQSSDQAYYVDVDFGAVAYPLHFSRFDPFVGLFVGYGLWTVPDDEGTRRNYRLHGVTLQLEVGMRVWVNKYLSVGALFRYFFPFWIKFCDTGIGDVCKSIEDLTAASKDFQDTIPGLLFFGAQATFHIQ
jgi:hypothetical protein